MRLVALILGIILALPAEASTNGKREGLTDFRKSLAERAGARWERFHRDWAWNTLAHTILGELEEMRERECPAQDQPPSPLMVETSQRPHDHSPDEPCPNNK